MTEEVTREEIAAAQRAVMIEDGCGLTIEGERTFCDDPRAIEPTIICDCKRAGKAAALAASQSRPTKGECSTCGGRGYVVQDAEWEPIAIQCPACRAPAVLASAPAPSPDNGPSEEFSVSAVSDAMDRAWNEICYDTGCHPLDITHQGKKLFFSPQHWARLTAKYLFVNAIRTRLQSPLPPPPAQGGAE